MATILAAESGLNVIGTDLYPELYTEAAALYATTSPVDARDADALLKVIKTTSGAALMTYPPCGRDHHRIAEAFLRLLHGGCIHFAALLVPHQFDAAGQRGHLFQDPHCALRIVMPWRPAWIAGTNGGGTISSTWWVWTAEPRPSACQARCGSRGGRVRAPAFCARATSNPGLKNRAGESQLIGVLCWPSLPVASVVPAYRNAR